MAGTPSAEKTLGIVSTNPGDRGIPSPYVDSNGKYVTVALDAGGNLPVSASFTPSGTQDVNIVQVGGNAVTTSVPVSATNLDIRDLTFTADKVDASGTVLGAGDNNIGNVDIVTIPNVVIGSGTVTTVSTLTGGGIAHDSADSGNPHKVGFKAYSPDGTTPGTAVAELDRSDSKCDLDGRLYVNTMHPVLWSYHLDTSTAQTDTTVKADPGDGFQIIVTSILFSTGSATACNIFFEEGSTKVLGPWYLEAVAGRGFMWTGHKPITASTALTFTTSASIAQALDVCGYVQAV